jgi:enamidase
LSLAIINIGASHDGSRAATPIDGDAVSCDDGVITWIGSSADVSRGDHQVVVDAAGATLVPGLIDSHVHTTFGDYTPRQQTLGFLESYVHGGTTRVISASEVHVPGRPTDPVGVKALAIAASRCFETWRPGGMTVHAGSVILEPGLTEADFRELREQGVWLAKAGFGAFPDAHDYVPVVAAARQAGITVMCHSGGGSIPGSKSKISAELLLEMEPDIAGHINGGPTSLSVEENRLIVAEGREIALQLVQAGNLRSAIDIAERALEIGDLHRILIATDTPTGTGVIPLGMLRSMAELASLSAMTPEQVVTATTGNVAATYGLDAGSLSVGAPADLLVLDAPIGSNAADAFHALRIGDIPAVACVVTEGELRVSRSRNTPPPSRGVTCQTR